MKFIQWLNETVRKPSTAEFKQWVGYSKLPIQYHYSSNSFDKVDVTKSDLGFHVGTLEQAEHRKKLLGGNEDILSFFVNIRNPLKLKDNGSFHADNISEQLLKKGIIDKKLMNEINDAGWKERKKYNQIVRNIILNKGYDGIMYKNEHEGNGVSYIIIDPTTIKSTSNSGKFSNSNLIKD